MGQRGGGGADLHPGVLQGLLCSQAMLGIHHQQTSLHSNSPLSQTPGRCNRAQKFTTRNKCIVKQPSGGRRQVLLTHCNLTDIKLERQCRMPTSCHGSDGNVLQMTLWFTVCNDDPCAVPV